MVSGDTYVALDHSSIIPCGNKPDNEKIAIKQLGEILPKMNIVWITSRNQLKTIKQNFSRVFGDHHPLPRLQASFELPVWRNIKMYGIIDLKQELRQREREKEIDVELKIKIVDPLKGLDEDVKEVIDKVSRGLSHEDREFVALVIYTCREIIKHHDIFYVSLLDKKLEDAVRDAIVITRCSTDNVKVLKPSELLTELDTLRSRI